MIKVGLTGNIGSGKSTVCRVFSVLGVPVFHADIEAKNLYKQPAVREDVRHLLGSGVFGQNGDINKKAVAHKVFEDKDLLDKLNQIIHPRVRKIFINWCEKHNDRPYIIQEAAILFESGFNKFFDKIITVAADENIRIQRIIQRDKLNPDMIRKRMQHQMPEAEKISMSDFVIRNDGSELVIPQVVKIHQSLTSS